MNPSVIVVGFIASPDDERRWPRTTKEAERRPARMILLHSSKGGRDEDPGVVQAHRVELELATQALHDRGLEVEVRDLVRGFDPSEDLVAVANEVNADLIVMELRRRSAVGKLLLGSDASSDSPRGRLPSARCQGRTTDPVGPSGRHAPLLGRSAPSTGLSWEADVLLAVPSGDHALRSVAYGMRASCPSHSERCA